MLFYITMHADAAGILTFASDPADIQPDHPTLVYDLQPQMPIPADEISYGQVVLHVLSSVAPTAALAQPANGANVETPTINVDERYIDVTYADLSGSGLNTTTITDDGEEFTLTGAAASGVTVNGKATLVSGTTYRYTFSGDFAGGAVGVSFQPGTFADNAANANVAASQNFTVIPVDTQAPMAALADPVDAGSITDAVINSRGYIDVTFADAGGSGLDLSTITDPGAEFTLGGPVQPG